jgi:ubiquinol-cytochrome c reductase cytochrome c1 subunit
MLRPAFLAWAGALATLWFAAAATAAEELELEPAANDIGNVASLQRGARNYINYCSGCHSAKYVRYNSIANDLMISEEQIIQNLMFNAEKTFETIEATMRDADAEKWFGRMPPDLSLMARAKGTDYIYNFLKGFYLDPESPTGVNNLYLEGASMPHVLWELQGYQEAVFDEVETGPGGGTRPVFSRFENVTTGTLSPEEYDEFVRDTVNFLEYISEPMRGTRRILGVWVLIFLAFFLIIASMLKKQIWKDVS